MNIDTSPYSYTKEKDIINNLSSYRFNRYLKLADQDTTYAFNLYLYNSRLAKSLLFPLHILEVSLRNKIASILETIFKADWHENDSFISILTDKSKESLIATKKRLSINKHRPINVNDVIAGLSFDFWSNLFRHEYDRVLWQKNMSVLLPFHPKNISRKNFQKKISNINNIRNRIAHHEHILNDNISDIYNNILEIIGWICPETEKWVKHYGSINIAIRSKPSKFDLNPVSFKDRADKNFLVISYDDTLSKITEGTNYFIVMENNSVIVISKKNIQEYIFSLTESDNILCIDLNDFNFQKIINFSSLRGNTHIVKETDNFYLSESLLVKKIRYIACQDDEGKITGIIEKAHRKY